MILYYILVPLAWLVFHIGFRVRCEGRENLKKIGTKGCIIAPNHISAIDPVFVVIARFWGQRMTVFAKKELFEINPFLSWFFRCAGAVCVRGTKEEVSVIEDTVKSVRRAAHCCSSRRVRGSRRASSFPSRAASSSSRRQQMWTSCLAASTTTPPMVR